MQPLFVDIHTHNPRQDVISPIMCGIHPWDAASGAQLPDFAGCDIIGETGLDFACKVDRELQQQLFEAHLNAAQRLHKPIVLHVVRSFEQVMRTLHRYTLCGVLFHGFIGSTVQMQRCVERGYCLSFGERSLRSTRTRECIAQAPIEAIFCETDDSPYPAIEQIYSDIAALRATSVEQLQQEIYENYKRLIRQR